MRLHPWLASADHTTFVFRSFLFLCCSWPIAFVFVKAFSRDQDIISSHGGTRHWDVGMVRFDPSCGHLQNVGTPLVLRRQLLILVGLLVECCWDHSKECWQMITSWPWQWLVTASLAKEMSTNRIRSHIQPSLQSSASSAIHQPTSSIRPSTWNSPPKTSRYANTDRNWFSLPNTCRWLLSGA